MVEGTVGEKLPPARELPPAQEPANATSAPPPTHLTTDEPSSSPSAQAERSRKRGGGDISETVRVSVWGFWAAFNPYSDPRPRPTFLPTTNPTLVVSEARHGSIHATLLKRGEPLTRQLLTMSFHLDAPVVFSVPLPHTHRQTRQTRPRAHRVSSLRARGLTWPRVTNASISRRFWSLRLLVLRGCAFGVSGWAS